MYKILDKIENPRHIKQLNFHELAALAAELREYLIQTVAKTGGHLASNLGVVELTLALFKTLDMPQDSVIWDVGHQTYVHKLLTGRRERFSTLRRFGGLSGFPKSSESEFDVYNTGHSSTSVSAALGMTKAADLLGEEGHTVAVIGDGALTGGMAFEALNDAGAYKKNFIVILNDNEMSIAQNVGALSRYLTKLRTDNSYFRLKSEVEQGVGRIPTVGQPTVRAMKRVKDSLRHMLTENTIFEDFGFTYLGPIDGHDLPLLCNVLEHAKTIPAPVLIHIKTKKGKGYKFAEERPAAFHGVASFQVDTGETLSRKQQTYSSVFGESITKLARSNPRLCAVTAAMPDGTGLREFSRLYPDRFFDVGIAEQHAVSFAAGLSARGLKPVVAVYSSFLQRAYDQILHDVCLQNLDLVFCIDRAGLVGEDGETHQGIYDLAFLSHMPNMTILAPASFTELRQMLAYAVCEHHGPIAIRYPRGGEAADGGNASFRFGQPQTACSGRDVCLLSVGHMLQKAAEIKEILSQSGHSVTVTNLQTIWPLNKEYLKEAADAHRLLVTLEDGVKSGGIGEKILSCLEGSAPILIKAHENGIVPHGSVDALYKLCGLEAESVAKEIIEKLQKM